MLMYGVDAIGMADTQLSQARRLVAKAVAPAAGGKSYGLVLYSADGVNGTLDPAFSAHVLPLQSWALAHWQHWQPLSSLQRAMKFAQARVLKDGQALWGKVTGPAAAVVASAARLNWRFIDSHIIACDDASGNSS